MASPSEKTPSSAETSKKTAPAKRSFFDRITGRDSKPAPEPQKVPATPVTPPAQKKTPATKTPAKSPATKAAAAKKPAVKAPVAKSAAKTAAKTPAAKPVAKSATGKAPAKPVAKAAVKAPAKKTPVEKAPTKKAPVKKAAPKAAAKKPATGKAAESEAASPAGLSADVGKDDVAEKLGAEVVAGLVDISDEEEDDTPAVVHPFGALVLSSTDDDDAPIISTTITGATADPVKDYLKQIGRVALLNAEQEVSLALRIEAGLFSEEKLSAMTASQKNHKTFPGALRNRQGRAARKKPPFGGKPAFGCFSREAIHRTWDAVPGPYPRGKSGPNSCGGKV